MKRVLSGMLAFLMCISMVACDNQTNNSSILSDMTGFLESKDSDGDGYNDDVDLNPTEPYKVPIILLHGRISNTAVFFGVRTGIEDGFNDHFGSELDQVYKNASNHEIVGIDEGRLGAYLTDRLGYQQNKNLFAFNYPNQDMVQRNAILFGFYMIDLVKAAKNSETATDFVDPKYVFATKDDLKNGNVKFILIGHSMGGLVSRYYIENIGTQYVEKLITIDTPHYGSSLANASTHTSLLEAVCDWDLRPDSRLYGGDKIEFPNDDKYEAARDEMKYGYTNQSQALKGNHTTDVKYYAIAGYDADDEDGRFYLNGTLAKELEKLLEQDLSFSVIFDRDVTSLQTLRDSINNALSEASVDWFNESSKLALADSDGDNVVNWTSQLAVRFGDTIDSQKLTGAALVLATGHNVVTDMLHTGIADKAAMHETVATFITDTDESWYRADDWTMVDAQYNADQEYVILTHDFKKWQSGSMWYNKPVEGDFVFEMDYYTGSADRRYGGADGIVVAFYANSEYINPTGLDIGFSGCKGYGVELDTYYNSERGDPKEYNHIGLVKETVGKHIVYEELPEAEDELWHHLKVEVSNGVCSAYVDRTLRLSYEVEKTGYQRFGITSATGEGHNLHAVKNVYLTDLSDVSQTPEGTFIVASGNCNANITWSLDSDGTLTLSGKGTTPDYERTGKNDQPWASYRNNIRKVVVSHGIQALGWYNFPHCDNLTGVEIADTVTHLGYGTFVSCDSLEKIVLPDSITDIGWDVFYDCKKLSEVNLPAHLQSFGYHVFYRCVSLEAITIPASVKGIGKNCFMGCSNMKSVYFLGEPPQMMAGAFQETHKELTLYFVSGVQGWTPFVWTASDGTVYHTDVFTP